MNLSVGKKSKKVYLFRRHADAKRIFFFLKGKAVVLNTPAKILLNSAKYLFFLGRENSSVYYCASYNAERKTTGGSWN